MSGAEAGCGVLCSLPATQQSVLLGIVVRRALWCCSADAAEYATSSARSGVIISFRQPFRLRGSLPHHGRRDMRRASSPCVWLATGGWREKREVSWAGREGESRAKERCGRSNTAGRVRLDGGSVWWDARLGDDDAAASWLRRGLDLTRRPRPSFNLVSTHLQSNAAKPQPHHSHSRQQMQQ